MMAGELIAKEEISNYKIVDAAEDHSQELREKLKNAVRLGNEFKSKAVITFQTDNGPKKVETTVWAVTESYVQLKNGVLIPTKSLIAIEY